MTNNAYLTLCRILSNDPCNSEAFFKLGEMFTAQGAKDLALPCLLSAAELAPGNKKFGDALAALGHMQTPASHDEIHRAIHAAFNAVNKGQLEAAFALAKELIVVAPSVPMSWIILSHAGAIHTRKEFSELCARRALALNVQNPESWSTLAKLLIEETGRDHEAETVLTNALKACDAFPGHVEIYCNFLIEKNRAADAVALFTRLKGAASSSAIIRLHAEAVCAANGNEAAAEHFRELLAANPDDPSPLLAAAAYYDGKSDASPLAALFKQAKQQGTPLDHANLFDAEARALFRIKEFDAAFEKINRALSGESDPAQTASRLYTLAAIEDKRKHYREAFASAEKANDLIEQIYETNGPCDHAILLNRLGSLRTRLDKTAPVDNEGPVNIAFLVGFPRSGTTLLDAILRTHSKVEVFEETRIFSNALRKAVPGIWGDETNFNEKWLDELHAADPNLLRNNYLVQLSRFANEPLTDEKIYIDKLPLNMHWAAVIHRIFPRAVFILSLRHPLDSAISNFLQAYNPNNAMMNMTRLTRINRLYEESFDFWDEFSRMHNPNIVPVRYESLIDDLAGTVSPVMRSLGLEWEPAQEDFAVTAASRGKINTPSAAQIGEALYATSMERWRNYAFAFSGEETAGLKRWAQKLGYAA